MLENLPGMGWTDAFTDEFYDYTHACTQNNSGLHMSVLSLLNVAFIMITGCILYVCVCVCLYAMCQVLSVCHVVYHMVRITPHRGQNITREHNASQAHWHACAPYAAKTHFLTLADVPNGDKWLCSNHAHLHTQMHTHTVVHSVHVIQYPVRSTSGGRKYLERWGLMNNR